MRNWDTTWRGTMLLKESLLFIALVTWSQAFAHRIMSRASGQASGPSTVGGSTSSNVPLFRRRLGFFPDDVPRLSGKVSGLFSPTQRQGHGMGLDVTGCHIRAGVRSAE